MKICVTRFNLYLSLVLLALATACETTEERTHSKEAATMRVFLEAQHNSSSATGGVPIYRLSPIRVNIEREPVLSEAEVETSSVVDMPGGFAIRVQFDGHGVLLLEGITAAHKGKHLVIQSNFGETRWLAAPLINQRISNGELVFTPDATREEAERIVRGLNNLVAKSKSKYNVF